MPHQPPFSRIGLLVLRRLSWLVLTCVCSHWASAQPPPSADQGAVESGGKFVPNDPSPAAVTAPAITRAEAEAALLKGLKAERLDANKLKIGLVTLDKATRSIRFQASVNQIQGQVEYALVTETGKRHESAFTTKASPSDIHLALLLLGVKPGTAKAGPDQSLQVPVASAIKVTVEWETNGPLASHPLAALIALAEGDPSQAASRTLPDGHWLYLGSGFDGGGFRAQREGSLISLIGDDAALINNPGSDRTNDEIHVPNAALLPKPGMPVTIVLSCVSQPAAPTRSNSGSSPAP